MIEESLIDRSLNRLLGHFGSHIILRPPATTAALARLESLIGPLPRDVIFFFSTCDGLRIRLQAESEDEHLWSVSEVLSACVDGGGPSPPAGMLALRGRPQDLRDWLVLDPGPMHGLIVRWDPWGHGEQLLGSSFGHYLDNWSHYVTEFYDRAGRPSRHAPHRPFDAAYAAQYDVTLPRLAETPDIHAALRDLEIQTACGDDFE